MPLKKIVSIVLVISLSLVSIVKLGGDYDITCSRSVSTEINHTQNQSISYSDHIEFNHDYLQLEREVIQFEIKFHSDDVVDVSFYAYVHYVDETVTSVYCLLTDGKKSLLNPSGGPFYIPIRKYLFSTPKIRLSVGKHWLVNLLNEKQGKLRIGSPWNVSGQFDVQAGDTWYLTLAIPASAEKTGFSVSFNSVNNSMEFNQLVRHGNLGFYSAVYHQFSGKYYALKLSWLGGFALCDVCKDITTKDGTILQITVAGHKTGSLMVLKPTGEELNFDKDKTIRYTYFGNETGAWKVAVKARSFYFIMDASLLYIDIDPHLNTYSSNNMT